MQDDPRWSLADPICTFVFALLVLLTTRAILRDISDILMERVPRSQDAEAITAALFAVGPALLMCTGCMAHLTPRMQKVAWCVALHIHCCLSISYPETRRPVQRCAVLMAWLGYLGTLLSALRSAVMLDAD